MTMQDVINQINCKYAKIENGGRDSVTFWIACKLKSVPTDSKQCEKCKEKQNEQ